MGYDGLFQCEVCGHEFEVAINEYGESQFECPKCGNFFVVKDWDDASEEEIGTYGEELIIRMLEKTVKGPKCILHNLVLPIGSGTTEIDVMMIHRKGIFVFESKNYSGWIFGSENQKMWTQTLPGGYKNRFYNPILQNKLHCDAISLLAKMPKWCILSYIVFSERCKLKDVPKKDENYKVFKRTKLIKKVKEDMDARDSIFSDALYENLIYGFSKYQQNVELKEKHNRRMASWENTQEIYDYDDEDDDYDD